MSAYKKQKTLTVGMKAPNFEGKTYFGKDVKLSDFQGKMVWLIFYRYPECPLCNLHLRALNKRLESYKKNGVEVIAVFESSPDKFRSVKTLLQGITAVSDPQKKLYQLYEAENKLRAVFRPSVVLNFAKAIVAGFRQGPIEGDLGQIPASFLIAEDGVIEKIYFGKTLADHIPFSSVEAFIQYRQQGMWKVKVGA